MPKISATGSKGLLIGYLVKIVLSTVISVLLLLAFSSLIFLKLDISLAGAKYVTAGVSVAASFIIALVSTTGFKNNFLLLSVISVTPLAAGIFINFLACKTDTVMFFIKLAGIFAAAVIVSFIKSAKTAR